MIDPRIITDFNASHERLEELLLFAICAASHNAMTSAKSLEKILSGIRFLFPDLEDKSPFNLIRHYDQQKDLTSLERFMKLNGLGYYNGRAKTFRQLIDGNINLKTCTLEDLESIHGIGSKTSRFFLLHTRKGVRYAALDVHILEWLRGLGYRNMPFSTPQPYRYRTIEKYFLDECDKLNVSPSVLDLAIWNFQSGKTDKLILPKEK